MHARSLPARAAFAIAAGLIIASCTDKPEAIPTEPAAVQIATEPIASATSAVEATAPVSSTCRGYLKRHAELEKRLAGTNTPETTRVRAEVAALDAMIADACN